jgi:hypothetical protein
MNTVLKIEIEKNNLCKNKIIKDRYQSKLIFYIYNPGYEIKIITSREFVKLNFQQFNIKG